MTEKILFGEFLVQKNLVKSTDILDLLVEQIRSQPSIAEIVYRHKLLSEDEQLQVLRIQSQTGWDYQQACVELKLWSEPLSQLVLDHSAKSRLPLGQLIVSRGLMTSIDLTRALDDFVALFEESETSNHGEPTKTVQEPPKVPVYVKSGDGSGFPEKSKIIPIGIPTSPQHGARMFFNIDPILLNEFIVMLPESRLTEIENMTAQWLSKVQRGGVDEIANEMRELGSEMDTLRGAARFVRAELVEQLMHLGSMMAHSFAGRPEILEMQIQGIAGAFADVYHIVFKIREILIAEHSEKSIWLSAESRASYEKTLTSLQMMMSQLVA